MWKISHEGLVTNEFRFKRGLVPSAVCAICGRGDESMLHLLRDYNRAVQVWTFLANNRLPSHFFAEDLDPWLVGNLKRDTLYHDVKWRTIFAIGLMLIWHSRNLLIFQGKQESAFDVGKKVLFQAEAVQKCFLKSLMKANQPHPIGNPISWSAPVGDSFKMNCDGAVSRSGEVAAAGGILRNQWGEFVLGFASHLGQCSIIETELRAILMGALVVKRRGLHGVELESDSMAAIKLIRDGCAPLHPSFSLVNEIRSILDSQGSWSITHVLREGNKAADCFAKFGLSLDYCSKFFSYIPLFASLSVRADFFGISFPRGL